MWYIITACVIDHLEFNLQALSWSTFIFTPWSNLMSGGPFLISLIMSPRWPEKMFNKTFFRCVDANDFAFWIISIQGRMQNLQLEQSSLKMSEKVSPHTRHPNAHVWYLAWVIGTPRIPRMKQSSTRNVFVSQAEWFLFFNHFNSSRMWPMCSKY